MMVRPTEPHDLNAFERLPEQMGELYLDEATFSTPAVREVLRDGWRTFWLDGPERPIAVVGLVPMWPGVSTIIGIFGVECRQHGPSLVRHVRALLATELRERGIRRLECSVRADWESALEWVKELGFQYEGPLRLYGMQGEDYVRMAYFPFEALQ